MALVFEDTTVRGGTHALIIGVGAYPKAKPGQGVNPVLRKVKDIASAVDSAKLMADWVLANRANLQAPLASLEVLISEVHGSGARYTPIHPALQRGFKPADDATLRIEGAAWTQRLAADPGSVALFYGCGHGANRGESPVLFLSDLNEQPLGNAWSHVNVGKVARAIKQIPDLASGFFFLDACGEFVLEFPDNARACDFITADIPKTSQRDRVLCLAAASAGLLSYSGDADVDYAALDPDYDGEAFGSAVRFGRFTQTLLKALNGASARWADGWRVDGMSLMTDIRPLHRTYFPQWNDRPFEPTAPETQNDRFAIVTHSAPQFPIVVSTDPTARTEDFDLKIGLANDGHGPWITERAGRAGGPWAAHVVGNRSVPFYALAIDGPDCYSSFFKADQPQFDHRVVIK